MAPKTKEIIVLRRSERIKEMRRRSELIMKNRQSAQGISKRYGNPRAQGISRRKGNPRAQGISRRKGNPRGRGIRRRILGNLTRAQESQNFIISSINMHGLNMRQLNQTLHNDAVYQEWLRENDTVRIIALGKTGVGKSTLLNGVLGKHIFQEGDTTCIDPQTTKICMQRTVVNGVNVLAFDSPGILDGTDEERYYKNIADKTREIDGVDVVLYCIPMDIKTWEPAETTIRKFTQTFGPNIWKNAVIALTFANSYVDTFLKIYNDKDQKEKFVIRKESIKQRVIRILKDLEVEEEVVNQLQFVPTGYYRKPTLPDETYWLSELWSAVYLAMKISGQGAFLQLTDDRITNQPESESISDTPLIEQPIIMTRNVHKGLIYAFGRRFMACLGAATATAGTMLSGFSTQEAISGGVTTQQMVLNEFDSGRPGSTIVPIASASAVLCYKLFTRPFNYI